MDNKLRRKLKRLGVVKGLKAFQSRQQKQPPRSKPTSKPTELPGELVETEHGPVWVDRQTYPDDKVHGRATLGALRDVSAETLALLDVPGLGPRPAFLDTETTGLAGGAGTLAFLTGVGVWEDAYLTLHLVFLRDPEDELPAMHYVADVLAGATGIVTFNGQGFDLPLLETRFILNRLPPRWQALPHLDLLPVARQLWRDHLPSRRLVALEHDVLGIERAQVDIDSGLIPWLYRQYLRTGEPGDMARVFYHNRIDILSLVTLLVHVAQMIQDPEPLGLAAAEWVGMGRVYDRGECEAEAFAAWSRALSGEHGELEPDCAERVWREMGRRYKRRESWDEAFAVWEAWIGGLPWATEPLVEQAKYYEWTAHDLETALERTEMALRRTARLPSGMTRLRVQADLKHRQARLERKIDRANS